MIKKYPNSSLKSLLQKIKRFSYNDISRFLDNTGRNGPSTWSVGKYKENQENFPVLGISWFEALAYCEFRGKTLPNNRPPPRSPPAHHNHHGLHYRRTGRH